MAISLLVSSCQIQITESSKTLRLNFFCYKTTWNMQSLETYLITVIYGISGCLSKKKSIVVTCNFKDCIATGY